MKSKNENPNWEGYHLEDGGIIEWPDLDDATIRRRDVNGNLEEIRDPGDENYRDWSKLFSSNQDFAS